MIEHEGVGEILITTHTITVDGEVIYQGEEWSKAATIFLRHVQDINIKTANHEIKRRLARRYGGTNHD